jgi:lipid A ethanolaminephosphotransferase
MGKEYQDTFAINAACLKDKKDDAVSHDNLFSTVLSLADVHSESIDPELDLIASCHPEES